MSLASISEGIFSIPEKFADRFEWLLTRDTTTLSGIASGISRTTYFGGQDKEEKRMRLAVSELIFSVKFKEPADRQPSS